ncbi:low-temperature-induced 65 kDa protein-like [Arachis duranensis]|uniref:Low-temperature-induced 65 kDa protein-like n=1 Tax=Arachis duranensis TaxID=130453 RepID=A0A6P4B5C5_ARADU|nr:low-temperature-induced 65 kDa protein-like [Arachis duranensis]
MSKHEENISSDTPSNQSSYTEKISSATLAIADKAVSAKNTVASKLGYGDKGESHEETRGENAAAATSTTEYGKRIAQSLTDKLAPVYGKVAGVGSAVKSKVPGTSTGSENDKGWSVKDYFAERLRPQDEDRALSKVISETLHHKRNQEEENVVHGEAENHVKRVVSDAVHMRGEEEGEEEHERRKKISMGKVRESEEVKRRLGSGNEETERYEECYVNSPGKSVVDKVKDVVFGSWFTKPDEDQPSEGGEQFSKNSGAVAMDQGVNQATDVRGLHESYK